MNEQTRLLALAHLKNGTKPADVANVVDISYAAALKLKKELHAAEEKDRILDLFKLNKAALDILLDSVRKQLTPTIEAFGIGELVDDEIDILSDGIEGGKVLQQEFQDSANVLAGRIKTIALTSTNADTILSLSEALCKLQTAFFKSDMPPSGLLPATSFEQHLKN